MYRLVYSLVFTVTRNEITFKRENLMKKVVVFISSLLIAALPLISAAQAADYRNSVGMEFNNIPAGSFYMGSCRQTDSRSTDEPLPCPAQVKPDKDAAREETPQHEVSISKSFQMGVHEVTLGQFKQYLDSLPVQERNIIDTEEFREANDNGDEAAVTYVSWEDAQKFIRWLNQKESVTAYRLPTEAEWEYAARAGTTSVYFWGDEVEPAIDYAWFNTELADLNKWFEVGKLGRKDDFAHPVGLKKANPWGLYDIIGNVWEWVNDWYSTGYYSISQIGRAHV